MRLTTFTDYSLRVLIYLAVVPGRRATVAEVAQAFAVSAHHMTKVVHFLGQQGWLANARGKGGGMALALAPEAIVVGAVVRATEGQALPAECFGDTPGPCSIARVCQLRAALQQAVDAFHEVLDGYTLADLVRQPQALGRVLRLTPVPAARRAQP